MAKQRSKSPASALRGFYKAVKSRDRPFHALNVAELLSSTDKDRVDGMARSIAAYIEKNLPKAIDQRNGLAAYRTNPYVLLTSASVMQLSDPSVFASFLFNNKLYMGLETSFGKSIESVLVLPYPSGAPAAGKWCEAPEKVAESNSLAKLATEEKAQKRVDSVWHEIDKSCVVGNRRFLVSIKSGPSCINDTQVKGMTDAISQQFGAWQRQTKKTYPNVNELDVVIGLTYGTDKTTNNKENQILVKLLNRGFEEEDRASRPGVLIDRQTRSVRVYRRIGIDFWSFIGKPDAPDKMPFVYLEVLLALARGLSQGVETSTFEERVNVKILQLSHAIANLAFPRSSLPEWIRADFREHEIVWLAAAMSAFYDQGI